MRRKDNKGRVLKEGEGQRKDGSYDYRWRSSDGKRHSIYAKTLEELREKEQKIQKDKSDGIKTYAKNITVNDVYELWKQLKKGIKDNTFQNYCYMYEQFVYPSFGERKLSTLKRSDIRRFYNTLVEVRHVKVRSVENIQTVMYQVMELAVEDGYIRNNLASNALKELKQIHKFNDDRKKALTVQEQELFVKSLYEDKRNARWMPIFITMLYCGFRVSEVTGLTHKDIDMKNNEINVNHALVYYSHSDDKCYYTISTPKTKSGCRTVPMIKRVKDALEEEKRMQELLGITCSVEIDGYTDFVFLNRYGAPLNQAVLNKVLKRIVRDCNERILDTRKNDDITLLPPISCHSLRHTFATRLCESGVNMKVCQSVLGHSDIKTTMNIYVDATKEFKDKEFMKFEEYL